MLERDTTSGPVMPEAAGRSKGETPSDDRIRACLAAGFAVYRVGDVYGEIAPVGEHDKWFAAAPADNPVLVRLIERVELGQTQEGTWTSLIEVIDAAGGLENPKWTCSLKPGQPISTTPDTTP